jgi:hypothetical protein
MSRLGEPWRRLSAVPAPRDGNSQELPGLLLEPGAREALPRLGSAVQFLEVVPAREDEPDAVLPLPRWPDDAVQPTTRMFLGPATDVEAVRAWLRREGWSRVEGASPERWQRPVDGG